MNKIIDQVEFEKTPAPGHLHVMVRYRDETVGIVTQFFRIADPICGPLEYGPAVDLPLEPEEPAPAKTNIVLEVQSVRHVLTAGSAGKEEKSNG